MGISKYKWIIIRGDEGNYKYTKRFEVNTNPDIYNSYSSNTKEQALEVFKKAMIKLKREVDKTLINIEKEENKQRSDVE